MSALESSGHGFRGSPSNPRSAMRSQQFSSRRISFSRMKCVITTAARETRAMSGRSCGLATSNSRLDPGINLVRDPCDRVLAKVKMRRKLAVLLQRGDMLPGEGHAMKLQFAKPINAHRRTPSCQLFEKTTKRQSRAANRGNQHQPAKSQQATMPTLSDLGIIKSQQKKRGWDRRLIRARLQKANRRAISTRRNAIFAAPCPSLVSRQRTARRPSR